MLLTYCIFTVQKYNIFVKYTNNLLLFFDFTVIFLKYRGD